MITARNVLLGIVLLVALFAVGYGQPERVDTAVVSKIKEEGIVKSQVMDIMSSLCDVYSPRLSWSPEYRRGAEWVAQKLKGWGITDVAFDYWAPLGKGWTLKNFSAMVTAPVPYPLIAFPAAWSPGLKEKTAEVVYLDAAKPEDLEKYKGKVRGKYVLASDPVEVKPHFEGLATRLADSVLLRMANADVQGGPRGARRWQRLERLNAQNIDSAIAATAAASPDADTAAMRRWVMGYQMAPLKLKFALDEGALAILTAGSGDGGTILVQGASLPRAQGNPPFQRIGAYDAKAPETLPQVVVAAEQYNRMIRMLTKGEKVDLEMEIQVASTKPDSGFNIIAEIPGTDLSDEVVMIGAHFDTWHSGTGATDNNTGTAVCMEAMRILRTLSEKYGLKTRRTIRMGLWGAEEQGFYGSRGYVSEVFARREQAGPGSEPAGRGLEGTPERPPSAQSPAPGQRPPAVTAGAPAGTPGGGPQGPIMKMPAYDNFSVYFNHDNGSGRIRGIHLQGNDAARPIFRSWLTAFGDPTAQTITIRNTGGTDHTSFDEVGLPGFQFIQDALDYGTRTHHFNMDVYERVQEEDMKQAASIMAFFAYNAANRDGKFPRKPDGAPGR